LNTESISQFASSDRKNVRRFVELERELMKSNPLFISEIDADITKRLSGRSEYFRDNIEHVMFIARKNGRDVARCAALINPRYQQAKGETAGFIGYFAAAPDCGPEVAAMMAAAEEWLRARGVTRVIAPYNGNALLGLGVLTAAHDESPLFPVPWTPAYYADYVTSAGFAPRYPLWVFEVDFGSEKYKQMKRRAAENTTVKVRAINKKEWKEDLGLLRRLLNQTFRDEWEFAPMTPGEFHEFFDQMKPILDPRNILFAELDGQTVGWCLGVPDWGALFRSFNGKVGPVQIVRMLLTAGKFTRAGLVGIGVVEEYKGKGVAHCLAATLYDYYESRGMKGAAYHPVNDHNARSRAFAESIGGTGRVLMHCYDKPLS
jgi:GNAT superfamily N-acetyltransferase